jgi:predicted HTH transcriptional regulator
VHYVVEHRRITRREYERLTDTTAVTAKRDLGDLVSKSILAKRGAARNIWYEMVDSKPGSNDPKMTRMTRTIR